MGRCRVWACAWFAAAALVAVFLLLPLPPVALADDGQLGGVGGDYYPLSNTHIRMASETVQAIVYRGFAEYQVDFLFVNSGAAQRVTLGFPFAVDTEDTSAHPVAFRAWQDGTLLDVTIGSDKNDPYTKYYVHTATFPKGETMIRVSYLARESANLTSGTRFPGLKPSQYALPDIYDRIQGSYDYWLHTGAGWAGTIGAAVVRYTLADDFRGYALDETSAPQNEDGDWFVVTQPASYFKPDDRTFEWVFKDLEPTEKDDVELGFTRLSFDTSAGDVPSIMGAMIAGTSSSAKHPDTADAWVIRDGDPESGVALMGQRPWVSMDIVGNKQIKEMRIVTGDNTTAESFRESGRPRTIKVTLSDGTTSTIHLADEPSVQKFPLSGKTDSVRLDVIDVYPGTKSADTYIAEVGFGNEKAPVFQSFAGLITASASVVTSSTVPVPTSSTGSSDTTDTEEIAYTAPPGEAEWYASLTTTTTTAAPVATATSVASTTDPAAAIKRSTAWTAWPMVLLAVAAAALVAAVVLTALLLARRKAGR